jgi:hypothetical protein
MTQREDQTPDPSPSGQDLQLIDSVEELLDLSRRKSGKFRAWSDVAPPGMCELVAEGGELRRARCEEFFGQAAVNRITMVHLPLRVERLEEQRERRRTRSRGPYYASEEESTVRMNDGPPRS